jgi:hypothetical protein
MYLINLNGRFKSYSLDVVNFYIQEYEKKLQSILDKSTKKSKGTYYTPDFIVEYIVKNSIAHIIRNKLKKILSPNFRFKSVQEIINKKDKNITKIFVEQVLPSIAVCDIAMGWGVFLCHVLDYLFYLYLEFINHLEDEIFELDRNPFTNQKEIKLQIIERIISNNIFGSDISEESVKLAEMKLIKKALNIIDEEEIFLPSPNFIVGNCLVGSDFFNYQSKDYKSANFIKQLISKMSSKDQKVVKEWLSNEISINWPLSFQQVFKDGGFDIILGNPPYINVKQLNFGERRFYSAFYKTYNSNGDISNIFWERSLNLCKEKGIISLIVPRYWLEGIDSSSLRHYISSHSDIKEIIDFRSNRTIFILTEKTLGVDTAIVTIQKKRSNENTVFVYLAQSDLAIDKLDKEGFKHLKLKQSSLSSDRWILEKPTLVTEIEEKADYLLGDDKKNRSFSGICDIGKGCSTGNNKIFRLSRISENVFKGKEGIKLNLEKHEMNSLRRLIKNSDIQRYELKERDDYWIYLKNENIEKYPNIKAYLETYKSVLETTQNKYGLKNYYDYAAYRSLPLINSTPKIIGPYQAEKNRFTILNSSEIPTIYEADVITLVIKKEYLNEFNWFYLLAILNSDLIHYYTRFMNKKIYNLYDFRSNQIANFPIMKSNKQEIFQIILTDVLEMIDKKNLFSLNSYTTILDNLLGLLNFMIFELYFEQSLSTNLRDNIKDRITNLARGSISKKNIPLFLKNWNDLFNDNSIKNEMETISKSPKVKQIRKELQLGE